MKLETTVAAFAVKDTGLPVSPVTVAVRVLTPGLGPVDQEPTVAMPPEFVCGVAPVTVPPPPVTAKVTVTPPTPLLLASVTLTDGFTPTA